MRYELILACFEAKETNLNFPFPTKCSNVYCLHFLHTKFYLVCDVWASKWVSGTQTFSPATSCGWIGTRVSLIWQDVASPHSLHVTLPNRVLRFISSSNFKLPFLCEFLTNLPETWFMGSPICILNACNNILCKIYLLQFHVFGSVWVNFQVKQLY